MSNYADGTITIVFAVAVSDVVVISAAAVVGEEWLELLSKVADVMISGVFEGIWRSRRRKLSEKRLKKKDKEEREEDGEQRRGEETREKKKKAGEGA